MSHQFANLLDPTCLMEDLAPGSPEVLWSMIDYGTLGADPTKKPLTSMTGISNFPSPTSWAMGPGILGNAPSRFEGGNADIFSSLTPAMRLDEVEYLLEGSPRAHGMI